ncbi:DUF1630-domain-containing protein [Fomitiporia mediterranea MF3/22]|uniref:DUF1630-domain-containing protein n=1 Tax=Fomitiporia mediterranea (strain MF3/22) TaxID=694068 RepID=UPI000440860E|nr:DUF1630-domain-containing protein [Fomitiporia mediterranea MF3/22]EJD06824.1 DUF1630-domain-containing protein [Fomitiporia mediterranea MF3/22]
MRRPSSSSHVSPTSPDFLLERQERSKPRRPSLHHLSRSQTLPRSYPRSPVREKTINSLDVSLEPEVVLKLRRWIFCALVVNFDLDLGPVVDGICPPTSFSEMEKENICFSSFPDSFRYAEGAEAHTFRIREQSPTSASHDGFLYGFSYFRRRKDSTSLRGYDQRSLIILAYHPWPSLFLELIKRLGPMFLAHGGPMLESACHNIANWPAPDPGTTHELGFLGSVLTVELPGGVDQQQSIEMSSFRKKFDPDLHLLASVAPVAPPPLRLFAASVTHLWSIWECILLCEPLLVFGPSPAMTSQAIWWFVDILRPVSFVGDFRPYFTIHDKEYHTIVNKNRPKSGLLLGVTNPLFESMCKHWPHKLSLGEEIDTSKSIGSNNPIIAGPVPGWQTKTHNRYISKDRDLLKQLESAIKKGGPLDVDGRLSLLLRRHFTTRSVQFLVPLNRYLNTLIPSPATGSVGGAPPAQSLKPFNRDHFFASLKTHGSPLPFRSSAKQKEFYERWLRTPAFGLWMAKQEETINQFLRGTS